MSTKLDDAFATLRNLITDQTRDLAMAMAELASVAQQRDKALTERDAARAGYSAMNTRIYGPGGECHELDKARAERDKLAEALERNCVQYVQKQQALIAERDRLKSELAVAKEKMDAQACVIDGFRIQRDSANWSLSRAKESLRAAEADLAETESINSDLRGVNKRLVADLAAAMERLNHAESIIMQ